MDRKQNLSFLFLFANQLLLFSIVSVHAQNDSTVIAEEGLEMGQLHIKNYDFEFNTTGEISIDNEGIVYFPTSTKSSINLFDGTNLTSINIANLEAKVSSVLVANDTLFLGGYGEQLEYGFITKNKNGVFDGNNYYRLPKLEFDYLNLNNGIWCIRKLGNAVYFLVQDSGIIKWENGKLKSWKLQGVYQQLFVHEDTLFVPSKGDLYFIKNDSLQRVKNWPGGDLIGLLTTNKEHPIALITTLRSGIQPAEFRLFDGKLFPQAFDSPPTVKRPYTALSLRSGYYIIGSLTEGIYIIDKNGKIITKIDKSNGLANNIIHDIKNLSDNTILVATFNGISQFNFPSPFSIFNINTPVKDIIRHRNNIFIGTRTGLFKLNNAKGVDSLAHLIRVKGTEKWWITKMVKFNGGILIGTNFNGLYFYKNGVIYKTDSKLDKFTIWGIYEIQSSPGLVLINSGEELILLEYKNNSFQYLGDILKLDKGLGDLIEDQYGNIFIDSARFNSQGSVYHLKIDDPYLYNRRVKEALLDGSFKFHIHKNNKLISKIDSLIITRSVTNSTGSYNTNYYNIQLDSFILYNKINYEINRAKPASFNFEQSNDENIYTYSFELAPLSYGDHISENIRTKRVLVRAVRQSNKNYVWENDEFQILPQIIKNARLNLIDNNQVLWFSNFSGGEIVKYDPRLVNKTNQDIATYINSIRSIPKDSIIFRGYTKSKSIGLELPFDDNNLRLNYTTLSFNSTDSIYYRYKLNGYDKNWSEWSHETQKDYTGLGPGKYTFEVQTIHPILQKTSEASMAFVILPPWYGSTLAYIIYVLLSIGLVWSIVKLRVRQLEKERDKLELQVHERTLQLKEKTLQLEEQAKHLKEMDTLKSRFFANISHEFRTPLTLILGPLNKLYKGTFEGNQNKLIETMIRNAKRLQQLINDLLDLSKLDADKLRLNVTRVELNQFLKQIKSSYSSLADSRNIKFGFTSYAPQVDAYVDVSKLEQVFYNLLSNAFKFTESGGKITVTLDTVEEDRTSYAEILVADTGKGIPAEKHDKIFDRFYQVEPHNYETEGTGIGLALTKELVELHHGNISVSSEEQKGTTFKVRIPLGKEHFSKEQLMQLTSEADIVPQTVSDTSAVKEAEITPETATNAESLPLALLVEDNPDMRAFIRMLMGDKYQLQEAVNGKEGLEKAIELQPDIIISDVMMPEMDGITLCEKIKTDWQTSHIPVVLLTAKADQSSRLRGLSSHADDYLTKPFNEEELLLIVDNRIRQRKILREKWERIVNLEPKEVSVTPVDEKFLNKLTTILEECLDNPNLGVEEVTREMALSHSQLHRKLRALTDQSTTEFIRTFRLKRARQLIEKKFGSISEIAYKVGFSSPSYFSKSYKKLFGHAPSETME